MKRPPDPKPNDAMPDQPKQGPTHPIADPVANPSPPMDGKKPIPVGESAVEKFLVATDTEGGD